MKKFFYTSRAAFTLLEIMIVLTIMSILMMAVYMPYAHHQKKTLLRQAAREVSQSLSDARNFAIHGLDTGSGNLSIGLYIPDTATELLYYAYPYDTPDIDHLNPEYLYKTKKLPQGTQIENIGVTDGAYLFEFQAISGSGSATGSMLPIRISYKGATDPVLQSEVRYYPESYVSDY